MIVGILTYHFSNNFGALLQAYALQKWFANQGVRAEFIPYHPAHVEQGGPIRLSLTPSALRANAKSAYLKVSSLLQGRLGGSEQGERFTEFRKLHLHTGGQQLRSSEELAPLASRYKLIVAGSDQIWSPSTQFGFDPVYFLQFARGSAAHRISYAASFGRDNLSKPELSKLGHLLDSISSISVREASGIDIVRAATGRDAFCVPDPTLLNSSYNELLQSAQCEEEDHIFCYPLRTAQGIREAAELTGRHLSSPVISPHSQHRRWRSIGKTVYPGPIEWLSMLSKSRFVVTNSFHGVAFSILFRKPFIVVEIPGNRSEMNSRSRNLLDQLGLLDRFARTEQLPKIAHLIDTPIDWDAVGIRQARLRDAGESFLLQEISKAKSL